MDDLTRFADPGWYPAQGDPPRTVRFWNGRRWIGGPQPVEVAVNGEGIPFHHLYMQRRSRRSFGRS